MAEHKRSRSLWEHVGLVPLAVIQDMEAQIVVLETRSAQLGAVSKKLVQCQKSSAELTQWLEQVDFLFLANTSMRLAADVSRLEAWKLSCQQQLGNTSFFNSCQIYQEVVEDLHKTLPNCCLELNQHKESFARAFELFRSENSKRVSETKALQHRLNFYILISVCLLVVFVAVFPYLIRMSRDTSNQFSYFRHSVQRLLIDNSRQHDLIEHQRMEIEALRNRLRRTREEHNSD